MRETEREGGQRERIQIEERKVRKRQDGAER